MEMHQVRYFLAVARLLNFTRAANDSNVTQPSLTRAIKQLEAELGGDHAVSLGLKGRDQFAEARAIGPKPVDEHNARFGLLGHSSRSRVGCRAFGLAFDDKMFSAVRRAGRLRPRERPQSRQACFLITE